MDAEGNSKESARKASLATAPHRRELFGRLADSDFMLGVFARELPAQAGAPIQVRTCKASCARTRKALKDGRFRLLYEVGITSGGVHHEHVLLGIAPVTQEFLGPELQERCRALRDHPSIAPFRQLSVYVEELRLALLLFPFDPSLPALAELTGAGGARLLEACLPESRRGVKVDGMRCELRRYKPFQRAVLRIRATLSDPLVGSSERNVYAKLFADDQGASIHRDLTALWSAAQGSGCLRLPQPLGYDPDHRLMLIDEVPAQLQLTEWIDCIEEGRPLADGVDLERVDRCVAVAADALVELQRSGVRPEGKLTFRSVLARLRKDRDLLLKGDLQKRLPGLVARAGALLKRLEGLALADEPLAPCHGSYRHKQLLGDERSLTVIDWDGISLANPALDAAQFLGRLRQEPLRRPGSVPEMERLAETFRRRFLEQQPEVTTHLALYEALVLAGEVLRSFRRPACGEETDQEICHVAAAAEQMLDRFEEREAARIAASA